jgi:hypothetical protein
MLINGCGNPDMRRLQNHNNLVRKARKKTMSDSCKFCKLLEMRNDKLTLALKEIQRHNQLKNDIDSYLYEVAEWGLGNKDEYPNINNYK